MKRRRFLGSIAGFAAMGLARGNEGAAAIPDPDPDPEPTPASASASPSASASASDSDSDSILPLDRLGLQLYTVRDRMAADVDATLAAVAEIGYREVEFAGTFDRSAADLRRTLDGLGLAAPAAHVLLNALLPDPAAAIDNAAALGNRWLVVAWVPPNQRTLDDYRRFAADFNRIGEAVRAAGLRFAYHNHDFELARTGDVVPYDLLLESTDPSLVDFEMDLYWVTKGGGDPLDYIARYPGRFPLVHVKDMGEDGGMVDVGKGRIPFPRIFAQAERAGIRHYFVEHDNPRPDSLTSARASYAYLSGLSR